MKEDHLFDSFHFILAELSEHILTVSLNRPESSNAFNLLMIEELVQVLTEADRREDIRVILFKGEGRHFCAGGDIKEMQDRKGMFAGNSDELRRRYQQGIQRIPLVMESLQKPTIALVHGAAVGAGCDFAAMSDLRLGCERTRMGETFSKIALVPGDGGTYFLPRIIGHAKACEMFFTGKIYDAQECLGMGLLNELLPFEELEKRGRDLAKTIAHNSPIAIQMTKKALRISYLRDLQTSLDMLASFQGIAQRMDDHFEGLQALKRKRTPEFKGY